MDKHENEEKQQFLWLSNILPEFMKIYRKEKNKQPYHINLIDELHTRASENAHSRILAKLLQQKSPDGKFEILESFILYLKNKSANFSKIQIQKPVVTQEKERIDLWVRDNNYAIVIENKVAWAGDQPKQLSRYVDITKNAGFREEQIFVLYLSPTYDKDPNKQTWGNYYERDIRKNRYLKLSFKDDILDWLKTSVLPNIRLKDKYLFSAIEQYIDHLEGLFSIREIDKNMNMELQKFIKEKLGLQEDNPEDAIKILSVKEKELNNMLNQVQELKNIYNKKKYLYQCENLEKQLKEEFPYLKIVSRKFDHNEDAIFIGIKFNIDNKEFSALFECADWNITNWDKPSFAFGISSIFASMQKYDDVPETLKVILNSTVENLENQEKEWYGWKDISFEEGYKCMSNLIKEILKFQQE